MRAHPQGGEALRPAGAAIDQVRARSVVEPLDPGASAEPQVPFAVLEDRGHRTATGRRASFELRWPPGRWRAAAPCWCPPTRSGRGRGRAPAPVRRAAPAARHPARARSRSSARCRGRCRPTLRRSETASRQLTLRSGSPASSGAMRPSRNRNRPESRVPRNSVPSGVSAIANTTELGIVSRAIRSKRPPRHAMSPLSCAYTSSSPLRPRSRGRDGDLPRLGRERDALETGVAMAQVRGPIGAQPEAAACVHQGAEMPDCRPKGPPGRAPAGTPCRRSGRGRAPCPATGSRPCPG